MTFTKRLREGVRRGAITCSIRVWTRPRVRVGGRYAMDEGAIEIESIEEVERSQITPELARESGFSSLAELMEVARHGGGDRIFLIRFRYLHTL